MPSYDPTTGRVVDTPTAESQALVPIVTPSGEFDAVPASRVKAMLDIGYELDTPELRVEMARKAEFGNRPIAAGVAGAARGLSFGLSDLAADATGLVDSSTLKGLEEENQGASIAGELTGIALPGLGALKALGTAGKVAKGLGVGIEGATALGRGVEGAAGAVAEALGIDGASTAGRIASQYIPRALGMTAEAELYGIGHNLSQAVLNDEDLTAEALLAHADDALLVGGGLGLGTPALRRAGRVLFDNVVPGVVRETAGAMISKAAKGAVDQVSKFFDPDRSLQLFSGAMQKELRQDTGARFQKAVRGLREKGFFRSGDVAADLETGGFKRLAEGELPSQETALARLQKSQDDIGNAIRTGLADVDSAIAQDSLKIGTDGSWAVGTPLEAKRIYKFQREFKQALSDIAPGRLKEMRGMITAMRKTGQIVPGEVDSLNAVVDWGRSLIRENRGSLSGLQDLKLGLSKRITDAGFEKAGSPEVQILKELRRVVKENIEFGVELAKNETRYKGMANKLAGIGKLNETWGQLEQIRAPLDRAIARSEANVNVGGLRWRDMLAGVGGSSVGGAMAGPIGAVAGASLGLINKALQTDRGLLMRAKIGEEFGALLGANGAIKNVAGAVTAGAKEFVTRKALPAAERGARALAPRAGSRGVMFLEDAAVADKRGRDRQDRYKHQVEQLARLVGDPDRTADMLARSTSPLAHVGGGVRDKVIAKKMQAYEHLLQKAPRDPLGKFVINPTLSHYEPTDGEIQIWDRHVRAAAQPLSILDDLREGTVTPEAVETVQTLYPRLYAELQDTIATEVAGAKEPLPYDDRVQLGLLFNVPTDPSLAPEFMADMAAMAEAAPQESSTKVTGASKMSGEGLQTVAERLV